MRIFLCLLALFLFASPLHGKTLSGSVIHVSDGDTIRITDTTGQEYEIRLYGIDCPETRQSYGNAAKRFTSKYTSNQSVTVQVYDKDSYGRTVGVVLVGTVNINKSLIENGLAWQYSRYCNESFCDEWKKVEKKARQEKTGLWQEKDPTPPWEWRKERKKNSEFVNFLRDIEQFLKWILQAIDKIEEIINML